MIIKIIQQYSTIRLIKLIVHKMLLNEVTLTRITLAVNGSLLSTKLYKSSQISMKYGFGILYKNI